MKTNNTIVFLIQLCTRTRSVFFCGICILRSGYTTMSQNDYIQLIKTKNILCQPATKWPAIFSGNQYSNYSAFALETSVANSKQVNSQLILSGRTTIYDINVPATFGQSSANVPLFTICSNTNSRGNRVALLSTQAEVRPIRPVLKTNNVAC